MSNYEHDLQKIKQNLLGVKEHIVRSKARLLICVLENKNISLGCNQAGIQRRSFYIPEQSSANHRHCVTSTGGARVWR